MEDEKQRNLNWGRDSLMQAIAILRDEEEFDRKYGDIPNQLKTSRESTFSSLVDLIGRMRRQLDIKNKAAVVLKDISVRWQELLDDRNAMKNKILQLEQEKSELQKEVEELKSELQGIETFRSGRRGLNNGGSDSSVISVSANEDVDIVLQTTSDEENVDDYNPKNSLNISKPSTTTNNTQFNFSIISQDSQDESAKIHQKNENDLNMNIYGIRSDRFSQAGTKPGFSTPLLTFNQQDDNNPINIDSSYYNPSQYFKRQSTVPAILKKTRGRGGSNAGGRGRGGRMKSNTLAKDPSSEPKKRGKPRKQTKVLQKLHEESEMEESIIEDCSKDIYRSENFFDPMPLHADAGHSKVNEFDITETEKQNSSNNTSPNREYFDYTSAFLDETN